MEDKREELYNRLKYQALEARWYWDYYSGAQPLKYSHERLEEVFGRSTVNFVQNWCSVVVNAVADRLVFKGWDDPNETVNSTLDAFYKDESVARISREAHLDALVTGHGYVMVDRLDGKIRAFYNSPDTVTVLHSDADPQKIIAGMKRFKEDNLSVMMVYYPDRIERYEGENVETPEGYRLADEYPNPFGVVPIIEFTSKTELRNVIPLQDTINKLFADMMVVSEFNAFRQRWVITNADISKLKGSPQSLWKFPKGASDEEGTQVGEFEQTNIGMYLDAIDKLTNTIAVISRTPKHYFMNTGANISGEALMVMEAPLVKKCKQIEKDFETSWLELAHIVSPSDKTLVIWDKVETEQIVTEADAMTKLIALGLPLVTVLKQFGWSESQIDQMRKDKLEQKLADADVAQQALELARLRMEQTNTPETPETQLTQNEAAGVNG